MDKKDNLYEKLKQHDRNKIYPFHMPGHKRNVNKAPFIDPYRIDITEIDGFDDLNYAEGCLLSAEQRASELFGSDKTYFLVNGCTGGILAAIAACCNKGDSLLLARNCHKAVYNAMLINSLKPVYIWPEQYNDENGGTYSSGMLCGKIDADKIAEILHNDFSIKCVVITSPTYEGVVSDIESIAATVHKHGAVLIVDEAHGAHMGFNNIFPKSAIAQGADIVIHGIHKTLPSFTQTALLHVNGKRIDINCLEKYLSIFQTSSPSYILMGSIDYCIDYLCYNAEKDFSEYRRRLIWLYDKLDKLTQLYVLPYSHSRDASKLIICTDRTTIDGKGCYSMLLNKYKLQPEMASRQYVIMMTSVWDTDEAFERLAEALIQIDRTLDVLAVEKPSEGVMERQSFDIGHSNTQYFMSPSQAELSQGERIEFDRAAGRVSQEMIYVYPPGIPIIVQGEMISLEHKQLIDDYRKKGFEIRGLSDKTGDTIKVINKDIIRQMTMGAFEWIEE